MCAKDACEILHVFNVQIKYILHALRSNTRPISFLFFTRCSWNGFFSFFKRQSGETFDEFLFHNSKFVDLNIILKYIYNTNSTIVWQIKVLPFEHIAPTIIRSKQYLGGIAIEYNNSDFFYYYYYFEILRFSHFSFCSRIRFGCLNIN